MNSKIGLGGGCHWCTEAVFQSLLGVEKVEQGWVASTNKNNTFSEAVIVHFNTKVIPLQTLIEVHLLTHKSASNHSMRNKYRSAIYCFSEVQEIEARNLLKYFQNDFENKLITKVYPFLKFKASREAIQNYYLKNPEKPFCQKFILPKLDILSERYQSQIKAIPSELYNHDEN